MVHDELVIEVKEDQVEPVRTLVRKGYVRREKTLKSVAYPKGDVTIDNVWKSERRRENLWTRKTKRRNPKNNQILTRKRPLR